MATKKNKHWKIVRTVILNASAEKVWDMVGGFFTLQLWHPEIEKTEIATDQTSMTKILRVLTFPGVPTNTEELLFLDNKNFCYTYKSYAGIWGETVKDYFSEIRVIEVEVGKKCMVQWKGQFLYTEDTLTEFYENGFANLVKMFN